MAANCSGDGGTTLVDPAVVAPVVGRGVSAPGGVRADAVSADVALAAVPGATDVAIVAEPADWLEDFATVSVAMVAGPVPPVAAAETGDACR
jgi:hypothetical protein